MKTLHLTIKQAKRLAIDLAEYAKMTDSSNREIFKGFKLSFGDLFCESMQPDETMELTPVAEYLEIEADDDNRI